MWKQASSSPGELVFVSLAKGKAKPIGGIKVLCVMARKISEQTALAAVMSGHGKGNGYLNQEALDGSLPRAKSAKPRKSRMVRERELEKCWAER